MSNQTPYEIVNGPLEVYVGPVEESMPAVTLEPPGGNWVLLGTLGDDEYSEDGVRIMHTETIEEFRSLGNTAPVKAFRTEESLVIGFSLMDLTLEEYSNVMNFNTITTATDDKTMPIYKGGDVLYKALLVRGNDKSPYGTSYNIQWEIPRVRASGDQELIFVKGQPVGLAVEFTGMSDLSAASDSLRFGIIRTQFQN